MAHSCSFDIFSCFIWCQALCQGAPFAGLPVLQCRGLLPAPLRYSDPLRADTAVQSLCHRHGIAYMAYSSLGSQWTAFASPSTPNPVLTHPAITAIAAARNCSPAQAGRDVPHMLFAMHFIDDWMARFCVALMCPFCAFWPPGRSEVGIHARSDNHSKIQQAQPHSRQLQGSQLQASRCRHNNHRCFRWDPSRLKNILLSITMSSASEPHSSTPLSFPPFFQLYCGIHSCTLLPRTTFRKKGSHYEKWILFETACVILYNSLLMGIFL